MDAFFAAVEQKRRPEPIGKPLIIGWSGDPAKRGVVSTASYEARKFEIHSAMPLRTAYNGSHLYWPELDVALEIDNLESPEKYPLKSKLNKTENLE